MKLSDFVARFLAQQGIKHVFAITGGASIHLIHSIEELSGITNICPNHEQASAMAADGYARATGGLGAAISTSGPGATNMLTGVCCSYYDSVPVLYITGQVATFRLREPYGVRQMGFQETEVVDIFRSVTKYSCLIKDPTRIKYELEKAVYIATHGRPGPVLIDIPDDVQRMNINPDLLDSYRPDLEEVKAAAPEVSSSTFDQCINLLKSAQRPVLVVGWGVRLANATSEVQELIQSLGIPVIPTWAMADFLPSSHPLYVGTFGTHGTRHANFTIQNADLILSIGSRLDTHEAGSPWSTFGREAKKIIVDIDPLELGKFEKLGSKPEIVIHSDAKYFAQKMLKKLEGVSLSPIPDWLGFISNLKNRYPICPEANYLETDVNPYVFVKRLSDSAQEDQWIVNDTGCAIAWMMQGFEFKKGQRLIHAFNNTPMGYALPAAIGACFALNKNPVICVTGDGSLMMNIQELATVVYHQLPIKIILINNHGYSMIQQTQDQWMGSKYTASSNEGGLALPDFNQVAKSFGFHTITIDKNAEIIAGLQEVMKTPGPVFCNVEIDSKRRVIPQVKFGRPIEDCEPLLDRAEFLRNMIIKPMDCSKL